MKVGDLIVALSKANLELTVCQFTEDGPQEITDIGVYKGEHKIDKSPKLAWGHANGVYVSIGNPGDYDASALEETCENIKDLTDEE